VVAEPTIGIWVPAGLQRTEPFERSHDPNGSFAARGFGVRAPGASQGDIVAA
jgi:hypothetical protein